MHDPVLLEALSRQVLWAAFKYWKATELPPAERAICYSWIEPIYKERFGRGFHQAALLRLCKAGFLKKTDTSRGGNRRYYTLVDPDRTERLLKEWSLL